MRLKRFLKKSVLSHNTRNLQRLQKCLWSRSLNTTWNVVVKIVAHSQISEIFAKTFEHIVLQNKKKIISFNEGKACYKKKAVTHSHKWNVVLLLLLYLASVLYTQKFTGRKTFNQFCIYTHTVNILAFFCLPRISTHTMAVFFCKKIRPNQYNKFNKKNWKLRINIIL